MSARGGGSVLGRPERVGAEPRGGGGGVARAFLRVADFGAFFAEAFLAEGVGRSRTADFGADLPRVFRLLDAEGILGGDISGF